ncbi:MAG: hypothetical protein Q7R33_00770 [Nitrosarchaeum sp.]|nr:hypothetical protein [Nitrosarchaeum sp.]
MKYKVTIEPNGKWTTDVINKEKHNCADIVDVVNSFGSVKSVNNKKDDVPVHDGVHVSR